MSVTSDVDPTVRCHIFPTVYMYSGPSTSVRDAWEARHGRSRVRLCKKSLNKTRVQFGPDKLEPSLALVATAVTDSKLLPSAECDFWPYVGG